MPKKEECILKSYDQFAEAKELIIALDGNWMTVSIPYKNEVLKLWIDKQQLDWCWRQVKYD